VAHIHYTKDVEMPKINPELTHSTLNMLEDIAIEHIISSDYPNAGEILASTKMECLDTLVKVLPTITASRFEKSLLYGSTRFEGRGYAFQTEDYERVGDKISKIMKARQGEIYNRKQTSDLMPLVDTIKAILIQEFGEPTEDEKRSMKNGSSAIGNANPNESGETAKRAMIKGLKGGRGWKEGPTLASEVNFIDEIADQAAMVGKQLRSVLKRNNAMEFGGRYRSGRPASFCSKNRQEQPKLRLRCRLRCLWINVQLWTKGQPWKLCS
jgi:hypothetical protein